MGSPEVICVVQARMGSTRLPGKVLMPLRERPMLGLLLDRLARLDPGIVSKVVVATSDRAVDDPIAAFCADRGVPVVRGAERDVLGRYLQALEVHRADHVVRITGDCPLTDPAIVSDVVALHLGRSADYSCNVLPRTFPKGLDVEVVRSDALRAAAVSVDDDEREHVTPFLYRRPERFVLANLRSGDDLGELRWTVDTAADLASLGDLLEGVVDPVRVGWRDVLAAAPLVATSPSGGLRLRPATAAESELLLAWRNDSASVRFARSGSAVDRTDHERWLARVLDDPGVELDIVELDGEAVGMVRVDVEGGTGLVSVGVDPGRRGEGIGEAAMAELVARAGSGVRLDHLLAEVHRDNIPSRRIFERSGFEPTAGDSAFVTYEWSRSRWLRSRDEAPS